LPFAKLDQGSIRFDLRVQIDDGLCLALLRDQWFQSGKDHSIVELHVASCKRMVWSQKNAA
jgi:hypothetical protein